MFFPVLFLLLIFSVSLTKLKYLYLYDTYIFNFDFTTFKYVLLCCSIEIIFVVIAFFIFLVNCDYLCTLVIFKPEECHELQQS